MATPATPLAFQQLLREFIKGGWKFFTGLHIPGLRGVSFASIFIAFILIRIGWSVVTFVFGTPFGGGDTPRTSSTNKPKISKERQGDTH